MSSCSVLLPIENFAALDGLSVARAITSLTPASIAAVAAAAVAPVVAVTPAATAMASTESASGDNTSTGGCTTPNSNPPNYDSDARSDCVDEAQQVHSLPYHICPACRQPFCKPTVLSCLHTFCFYCVEKMKNGKEVICDTCHAVTKLETGCLTADTIVDYARLRIIDQMTFSPDDHLICRCCVQENDAVARCYECAMFLCNMCQQQHLTMHCYANHHVISLGDRFQIHPKKLFCMDHPEQQPHDATLYCYTCDISCCDLSQHQYLNPPHKVVSISDSDNFKETNINIQIEMRRVQETMEGYAGGLKRLIQCKNRALEDIEAQRQQLHTLVDQWNKVMADSVIKQTDETKREASRAFKSYHDYYQNLDRVQNYLECQNKFAQPFDNISTKPFVEKTLKEVNNSKPDPNMKFIFDFLFCAKDPTPVLAEMGYVTNALPPADSQISGYQQQPIARPTSMTRSTANQNYSSTDGYQNANVNGYNNRLYNQQPETYRSSSSNETNHIGHFNYERQQQRNGYESFPGLQSSYPRSSSSPMTVSQPNSATMANDNVFDFNLQTERTDGTNRNVSSYSSAHNGDLSYKIWSNGIDLPGRTAASPPMDDIFTHSSFFQAPDATGSSMKETPKEFLPHVPRKKMSFVYKFGEYGNSQGQFTEPSGVAVDNENRLVVADTNNSRIQVFDVHGQFLSQYSNTLTSKLTYPNRIAVSKVSGKVVITERAPSHRVQTYAADGRHLKTFGEDILQHPRGVAIDKDDNIIVIECKVMRVTIFSMEGHLLDQFSLSKDLQFPNSVAVNDRQEIFISDNRDHCVKVFSYEGKLLRTIGGSNVTHYPIAVAINQRGHVVVADNHNNFNITVFDQQGSLLEAFESKTKHAQCFDVALTDDGLAILTSKDYKVYCYPYQDDSLHHPHNQRR